MTEIFEILLRPQGWMYLGLLSVLEIVLGIDNIIFISIITDKLKVKTSKNKART
jgi:predicted tellurium resistance membrane protein TerC